MLRTLTLEGWFEAAHGTVPCLWTPPPAAMAAALEQFAKARHKRPKVAHVFVVPRLMTGIGGRSCPRTPVFYLLTMCIALPFVTRRVSPEPWL